MDQDQGGCSVLRTCCCQIQKSNRTCQFPEIPLTKSLPKCLNLNLLCDSFQYLNATDPSSLLFEEQYQKMVSNFSNFFLSTMVGNVPPDVCRELHNFLKDNEIDSENKETDEDEHEHEQDDEDEDEVERLSSYFAKFKSRLFKKMAKGAKGAKKNKKDKGSGKKSKNHKKSKKSKNHRKSLSHEKHIKKDKKLDEQKPKAECSPLNNMLQPLVPCPRNANDKCSLFRHDRCNNIRPVGRCSRNDTNSCNTLFREKGKCKCLPLNFESDSNESLPFLLKSRLSKLRKKPTFDCDEYIKSLGIL